MLKICLWTLLTSYWVHAQTKDKESWFVQEVWLKSQLKWEHSDRHNLASKLMISSASVPQQKSDEAVNTVIVMKCLFKNSLLAARFVLNNGGDAMSRWHWEWHWLSGVALIVADAEAGQKQSHRSRQWWNETLHKERLAVRESERERERSVSRLPQIKAFT